jgi:hypothetical protein
LQPEGGDAILSPNGGGKTMRRLAFLRAAGIAAALSATGSAWAQGAAPPGASPSAPDPAIWEGPATGAPIVHRASRIALPFELSGFTREKVGLVGQGDLAATYRNKDGATETVASVYLFQPGASREHKLRGSIESFADLHPQAFLWAAGPFGIKGEMPLHAWKGVFKTGIGPGTVMDYLYFVEIGRWTVKVRATVTGIKEPAQEARIDSLVAGLPWAQVVAASGQCSGRACTAPPFDMFRHHIMETTLGPMLASKMRFKPKDEAKLPSAGRPDVGILGKVDIRRSGEGDLVYVAAIPKFFTYRLVRMPAALNPFFGEAFGTLTIDKPVHAIVIKVGNSGLMPRLYNGEPNVEAFAAALDQLVLQEMPGGFVSAAAFAKTLEE